MAMDRRKSPVLFGDRILSLGFNRGTANSPQLAFTRIQDAVENSRFSSSEIYNYISKTTPDAATYMLGISRPINKSWTVSSNLQLTNLSVRPDPQQADNATFPPFTLEYLEPTTENTYTLSNQILGNSILRDQDSLSLIVNQSWGKNDTSTMVNLVNTNVFDKIKTEAYLSYINRASDVSKSDSFTTSVRAIYNLNSKVNLEAYYSLGVAKYNAIDGRNGPNSASSTSKSFPQSFYIGVRYDF